MRITVTLLSLILILFSFTAVAQITPIAQAIEDLNNDLIPDHLGDTLTVEGIIFTPNYQTTSTSYFIHDGTAGVDMFLYGSVLIFNPGDELQVTGTVGQYNGLAEIVPFSESDIITVSTGNPLPTPVVLTIGQYNNDPEAYEGNLIGFQYVSLVGGSWPSPGSYATVQISDGVDTVDMFIDSDTDIDDNPEPTWPQDVIGVGSQYCSGGCVDHGYQLMPRYYSTDFLPPGTLPVELTSFTAAANLNSVKLSWNTASEINNQGFEIQRSSGNGFTTVGFVHGQGTSTQAHSYSYTDQNIAAGHYTYRLKQVDFQGSYSFSNEVSVDIYPVSYSLEQNYPNPFNPTTIINFNLKIDSKVSLKVFNVLGQEVKQLVSGAMTAGNHQIDFNASNLNSGVYFYRLEAAGIDGSAFSAVKKMMLAK